MKPITYNDLPSPIKTHYAKFAKGALRIEGDETTIHVRRPQLSSAGGHVCDCWELYKVPAPLFNPTARKTVWRLIGTIARDKSDEL